jgi:hypothetical protein
MGEANAQGVHIGDTFGIAEDTFIEALYDFTSVCVRQIKALGDDGYMAFLDNVEQLAECFWGIHEHDSVAGEVACMVDIDEFELDVARVVQ